MENEKVAYKGMDSKMQCQEFQYEVGKEYKAEGDVSLCHNGFHACEGPLDVFDFYNPANSRFFEVEQGGDTKSDGTKTVSSKIKIKAEIELAWLIQAGVKFILERVKSIKTNTGDGSVATNTGYKSAASVDGKESIACGLGIHCRAKAKQGWIVIADWRYDKVGDGDWFIKQIYHAKVGGRIECKKILPDIWYWFEDGKLESAKA